MSPDAPPTGTERELLIDAARALAVCMVVGFHAGPWRVGRTETGWQARTMELGPWGWYGSWLLMVMPLFFVAGGFAHALVVDKMRQRGTGLAHYYANRGRRLIGPTTVFITFFAIPSTGAAWLGHLEDAVTISHNLTKLLWFLVSYLLVVLLAPALVWLHDRWWWLVPMVMFGAATAVDVWTITTGVLDHRYWNLAFVWLACHQIGIAHQRGFLRTGPRWHAAAAVAAGTTAIVLLLHLRFGAMGGWPVPALGMGSRWVSNLQPPTVAMAWLALAQTGVLGLLSGRRLVVLERPGVRRAMEVVNALLMTTYLWHMPCVVAAFGIGIGLGTVWPSLVTVTTFPAFTPVVALVLIAIVVPAVARLNLRMIPPLGPAQNGPVAVLALLVLSLSLVGVWRHGLVIHPDQPRSSLGVLGVWVGSALLAWAANRPLAASHSR
ncbi:acyltransferase-like protein [Luteococcus japonicus]|uniref:Acyltransferase-like protein n=1 Tax=Luteococcus japonicus TaxID=33984 RepID=A0A3N1ZYM2_9ACTN|nr:acyltransferase family protein [Luteococcus japonicus]ROR55943.1 acyltransferase-like protein [Luteococcus japonicus]